MQKYRKKPKLLKIHNASSMIFKKFLWGIISLLPGSIEDTVRLFKVALSKVKYCPS